MLKGTSFNNYHNLTSFWDKYNARTAPENIIEAKINCASQFNCELRNILGRISRFYQTMRDELPKNRPWSPSRDKLSELLGKKISALTGYIKRLNNDFIYLTDDNKLNIAIELQRVICDILSDKVLSQRRSLFETKPISFARQINSLWNTSACTEIKPDYGDPFLSLNVGELNKLKWRFRDMVDKQSRALSK